MPAGVPGQLAAVAHQSVGAAYAAAGKVAALGHPALGQALQHASTNAFLHGLTIGALVAGGVAAAGAILAVLFLPAQPAQPRSGRERGGAVRDGQPAQSKQPSSHGRISAMTEQITRQRDIESLKVAARWPGADKTNLVTLATRLAAAGGDDEGYRYF